MGKRIAALVIALVVACSCLALSAYATQVAPDMTCPTCLTGRIRVQRYGTHGLYERLVYLCSNYGSSCNYMREMAVLRGTNVVVGSQGSTTLPFDGLPSQSNTATVPKNYYTTNNNSSTTNYNTVNSGTTNYYSTINTTNRTINYTTYNQTTNNYVRNTYNYTNYTYNYDYNYYTVNVDNSTHYVIDNVNYITVLYPTGETVKDENGNDCPEYDFTDTYYELPDGRNSFNLTAEEVWGIPFVYDVVNYKQVKEDDGVTLALYHLDQNYLDSSAMDASSIVSSYSVFDSSGNFNYASVLRVFNGSVKSFSVPVPSYCTVSGNSWTLEYRVFASNDYYTDKSVYYSDGSDAWIAWPVAPDNLYGSVPAGSWNTVALVYPGSGSTYDLYVNGVYQGTTPGIQFTSDSNFVFRNYQKWSTRFICTVLYDEIRISKGDLFGRNNYAPASFPFDTNLVLVYPDSVSLNDVAVKSSIFVSGFRFGGVRPTYPENGYVYIFIENDKVKSVQQYQNDGWYNVEASIYTGSWENFLGFDLSRIGNVGDFPVDPVVTPDPDSCTHNYQLTAEQPASCTTTGSKTYTCSLCGDSYTDTIKALGHDWQIVSQDTPAASPTPEPSAEPDPSQAPVVSSAAAEPAYTLYRCSRCNMEYKDYDGTGPPKPPAADDGDSWWDKLVSFVKGLFDGFGKLVSLVMDAVSGVLGLLTDFAGVLASLYGWLPASWQLILTAGFACVLLIGVIKLFF